MNLHLLVYSWYVHSGACLIPPLSVESVVGDCLAQTPMPGERSSPDCQGGLALGQ